MNYQPPVQVPDKLYFRIGEVSRIVGVKPYVLRYWETEFSEIKPDKSRSGQRLYRRRDVEGLLCIRKLLYDDKFTINGARKKLKEINKQAKEEVRSRQVEAFPESVDDAEDAGDVAPAVDDVRDEARIVEHPKMQETVQNIVQAEVKQKAAVDKDFLNDLKDKLERLLDELNT